MPIVLFIAAGAAILFSQAKNFTDKLSYKFNSGKFDYQKSVASGFKQIFFNISLNLINPTSFTIEVKNISFEILHKGNLIATVNGSQSFQIKSKGSTPINFNLQIATDKIYQVALEMVQEYIKDDFLNLTIDGKIFLSVGSVKINQELKVL